MSGLGNVFDAVETSAEAPRGPDLRFSVHVPRSALGREDGFVAEVPLTLPHEGEQIERAREPDAEGTGLILHLSPTVPDGATLRLRGQGGVHPEGVPGDLWITIHLVDDPPRALGWRTMAVVVALALALALVAVLAAS